MSARLTEAWYRGHPALILLWPLAGLFWLLSSLRRFLFRRGILPSTTVSVPVIVVGNITVGGSGKTPLVLWLAEFLKREGHRPGIVSRGYGGQATGYPCPVLPDSLPAQTGDEPLLLARRSGVPVVVDPVRARGAETLASQFGCTIVISDDGLQHYAMARDIEIAVLDGERRLGNGWLLPAGPLRERATRLQSVDFIVCNGKARAGEYAMQLGYGELCQCGGETRVALSTFAGKRVHALAGIGNPGRFFALLRGAGLTVIEHPFPDHHAYTVDDLRFDDAAPLLMTEKDAVKCAGLVSADAWYLPVTAEFDSGFAEALRRRLSALNSQP